MSGELLAICLLFQMDCLAKIVMPGCGALEHLLGGLEGQRGARDQMCIFEHHVKTILLKRLAI